VTITNQFILPADAQIIEVLRLPESIREHFSYEESDYYISRPRSRVSSQVISGDVARLLDEFKQPSTIVRAVVNFSRNAKADAEQMLEDAYPVIGRLIHQGLLVEPGSPESEAIRPLLEAGDHIDDFQIAHCLQVTEESEIYKVTTAKGASAALKIARPGNHHSIHQMLEREAEILRRLNSTVTPRLIATSTFEDRPYLAIEWFDGEDVQTKAARLREAGEQDGLLRLCSNILDAYSQLHEQGAIHSDVHPRNVLVTDEGAVKLIDFGLAQLVGVADEIAHWQRGAVPFFLEPEYARASLQNRPHPESSFAGEQYSVAVLIYESLTGSQYLRFSLESEQVFRQIAEDWPIPFAELGISVAAKFEDLLSRALSKEASRRFSSVREFAAAWRTALTETANCGDCNCAAESAHQPLADVRPLPATGENARREKSASSKLLKKVLERLSLSGGLLPQGIDTAPTVSINYGEAGVAYALYRIACARDDASLLALADVWASKAARDIAREDAFHNDEIEITAETVGSISPYHSPSGVHFTRACIGQAFGNLNAAQTSIEAFVAASRQECDNLDVTLGRSGTLLAASLLLEKLERTPKLNCESLRKLGDDNLDFIWQAINTYPAIGESEEISYLGIAHGWAGILYAALRWHLASGSPLPVTIADRLAQLADCAEPAGLGIRWKWQLNRQQPKQSGGYMPGWCNGGAGQIFLWTLAHQVFREDRYQRIAEQAAIETFSNRSQAFNLCCGSAGQAYGLLNLFKASGEKDWLRQAEELTEHAARFAAVEMSKSQAHREMPPHSLYKGCVGVALLAAELERPELAGMPLFEP